MDSIVSTMIARNTKLERHDVQEHVEKLIRVTDITQEIITFAREIQFPPMRVDLKYLAKLVLHLAEIATNA